MARAQEHRAVGPDEHDAHTAHGILEQTLGRNHASRTLTVEADSEDVLPGIGGEK